MATPILISHELPGALGPILVDVRTSSRDASMPAVVVLHGFKGFKDFALIGAIGPVLARAGFTAVNLTVSGAGVDAAGEFVHLDRFARHTYTREFADIEGVLAELAAGRLGVRPPSSIGMIGHSRGGGVALCIARETPSIAALVTWAAMSTIVRYTPEQVAAWRAAGTLDVLHARTGQRLPMAYEIVEDALANADRFDILRAAREITIPWLLVHGTDDETIPLGEAEALARLATTPGFESLFLAGANHTFGTRHPWSGATAASDALFNATVRFLSRHLR